MGADLDVKRLPVTWNLCEYPVEKDWTSDVPPPVVRVKLRTV